MDRFFNNQNIERYRKLASESASGAERKLADWLNMVEIEIGVLRLDREDGMKKVTIPSLGPVFS